MEIKNPFLSSENFLTEEIKWPFNEGENRSHLCSNFSASHFPTDAQSEKTILFGNKKREISKNQFGV